jgi:hypothetical protein
MMWWRVPDSRGWDPESTAHGDGADAGMTNIGLSDEYNVHTVLYPKPCLLSVLLTPNRQI